MRTYGFVKRRYYNKLKLPNDIVRDISDYRNIRRSRNLSPLRNTVYILSWNEGGVLDAKVIGDDMSDVPIIYDINVWDDEFRDLQELLLFDWMIRNEKEVFINNLKGKAVILTMVHKGSNRISESDVLVFYDFGYFDAMKIKNIRANIGRIKTEK